MEYAHIIIHHHRIEPLGRDYRTYEWHGDRHWPIMIDSQFIECLSEEIPFRLQRIGEFNPSMRAYMYIRKDAYLPWWLWIEFKLRIQKYYWHFFNRFMATLQIWGLAYVAIGAIPSWNDIGKKPNAK